MTVKENKQETRILISLVYELIPAQGSERAPRPFDDIYHRLRTDILALDIPLPNKQTVNSILNYFCRPDSLLPIIIRETLYDGRLGYYRAKG